MNHVNKIAVLIQVILLSCQVLLASKISYIVFNDSVAQRIIFSAFSSDMFRIYLDLTMLVIAIRISFPYQKIAVIVIVFLLGIHLYTFLSEFVFSKQSIYFFTNTSFFDFIKQKHSKEMFLISLFFCLLSSINLLFIVNKTVAQAINPKDGTDA